MMHTTSELVSANANGFIQGIAAVVFLVVATVTLMNLAESIVHREARLAPSVLRALLALACLFLMVRVTLRAFGIWA